MVTKARLCWSWRSSKRGRAKTRRRSITLDKPLLLRRKLTGITSSVEADLELSKVLAKEKRYGEAELAAKESVEASRAIGDKLLVPRSLAQLAAVEESRGKYQTADQLFNEATDVVEAILSTTTTAKREKLRGGIHGRDLPGPLRAGRNAPE